MKEEMTSTPRSARKILMQVFGVTVLTGAGALAVWTFTASLAQEHFWRSAWMRARESFEIASLERLVQQDDACSTARYLDGRELPASQALALVLAGPARYPNVTMPDD